MPITYDEAIAQYGDVQGNILKGHGRDHAALLFFEITDATSAKKSLKKVLTKGQPIAITSTEKQLQDTRRYKEFGIPGDLFATLMFTHAGLIRLRAKTIPQSQAFAEGMRQRADSANLRDPLPGEWDKGWWNSSTHPPQTSDIHVLLLLADDDLMGLKTTTRLVHAELQSSGLELRLLEWGHALRNTNGDGIEHFGYADGVSQPIYLKEDMPNDPDNKTPDGIDRWNPSADPEKLVLVPDALVANPGAEGAFGSFFVFRKLEQNVRDFKEAEEKLAHRLSLRPEDEERAGAMLVGRFEDGTPVTERGSDGLIRPIVNNFNYAEDTQGNRCPFHAHIRTVNPRVNPLSTAPNADPTQTRARQLTRRGIPFGDRAEALKEDGDPVGLLFMCYQRSIEEQFEIIQGQWANGKVNPATGESATAGLDPIIGQGTRELQPFNYTHGGVGCRAFKFEQFVHLRGGEYFYAPSIKGLHALA